ncbi:histidinol-phosphate transaminase [Rathayibacter toxicus]|nr:histidinol-phosphate transaminase [Rathayibacter toxicus]
MRPPQLGFTNVPYTMACNCGWYAHKMPSSSTSATGSSRSVEARELVQSLMRPHLRGRSAYGAPQERADVLLNTNESAYALPDHVVTDITRAIEAAASSLNRYPDREFTELRRRLSEYLQRTTATVVDFSEIWAGNGSNEILSHVVQAFGGDRGALGFTPTYAMYPNYCVTNGTPWTDGMKFSIDGDSPGEVRIPDAVEQVQRHDPAIVFIASPNNPTGRAVELAFVEAVYESAPHAVVVVDEAYHEFSRDGTLSAVTLVRGRPRLIVSRTMSKAFSLAGARLGYLVAHSEAIEALRLVRLPYHLSTQTQVIAITALRHSDALLAEVATLRSQRDRLVVELGQMGLKPIPSDANFVLFGGLVDKQDTWQKLLARGVLVRDVGIDGHLRVTAGSPSETTTFLSAMRAIVDS